MGISDYLTDHASKIEVGYTLIISALHVCMCYVIINYTRLVYADFSSVCAFSPRQVVLLTYIPNC